MPRRTGKTRGLRPKTQVPGVASISHIRPEEDTRARSQQRHPSTGHYEGANIAELTMLRDDLQKLVTEAHGLLKDLRIESKQARRILPMIVSKRIKSEVEKQLAEMGEQIAEAMRESVEKVGREFDRLEAAFLGKDKTARRDGKPSIPELVDIAVEARALGPAREIADGIEAYKYGPTTDTNHA